MQAIIEPSSTYHQTDALTSGKLADLARSPRLYHKRHVTREWPQASSPAFGLGTLCHLFTLEPERACAVRSDAPVNEKTGKPYGADTKAAEAWRAEVEASGGIAASEADVRVAQTVAEHVREVALLCDLPLGTSGPTGDAVVERTVRGTDPLVGVVQCRPDLWSPSRRRLWDLKTTSNLDGFRYQLRDLQYALKAAWYLELVHRLTGEHHDFRWVVAESIEPYRVLVVSANESIGRERERVPELLRTLATCRETDTWPLQLGGYERSVE